MRLEKATDIRLSWNKEEFGEIDRIWLSSQEDNDVWLPDTMIREDAGVAI